MKANSYKVATCTLVVSALLISCEGLRNTPKPADPLQAKVMENKSCPFKNGGLVSSGITGNLMVRIYRDAAGQEIKGYGEAIFFEKPADKNPLWENFTLNRGNKGDAKVVPQLEAAKAKNRRGGGLLKGFPDTRNIALGFRLKLTDAGSDTHQYLSFQERTVNGIHLYSTAFTGQVLPSDEDNTSIAKALQWTSNGAKLTGWAAKAKPATEQKEGAASKAQPNGGVDQQADFEMAVPPDWTSFTIQGIEGELTATNFGAKADGKPFNNVPVDDGLKMQLVGDPALKEDNSVGAVIIAEQVNSANKDQPQTTKSRVYISCADPATVMEIPGKDFLQDLLGGKNDQDVFLTVGLVKSGNTTDVNFNETNATGTLNYWVMAGDRLIVKFIDKKKTEEAEAKKKAKEAQKK